MFVFIENGETTERLPGWAEWAAKAMCPRRPIHGVLRHMAGTLRARTTSCDAVNAAAVVVGGNVHVCLLFLVERSLSLTRGIDLQHRQIGGNFIRL